MTMLKKSPLFEGVEGPVVTIVMDGVGLAADTDANAVAKARTPMLELSGVA